MMALPHHSAVITARSVGRAHGEQQVSHFPRVPTGAVVQVKQVDTHARKDVRSGGCPQEQPVRWKVHTHH